MKQVVITTKTAADDTLAGLHGMRLASRCTAADSGSADGTGELPRAAATTVIGQGSTERLRSRCGSQGKSA